MSKKAFAFLALLLALCVAGSLLLGKYGFGAGDYARYVTALLRGESLKDFEVMHTLLLDIRLPRILACVLIGASLAISGAAYQAMFVNPLVSPSILGVLSGAGFGAAVGMFFKLNEYLIQLSTFGFGFLAVAVALGVNTARVKIFIILVATFVSALSVTIAGIIGWIGLIVPHIARFIFDADNRAVLASSAMIGAIFLLFCDSFSRLIFTFEIPIGIVTSLFGIPMFIVVLRRAKRSF